MRFQTKTFIIVLLLTVFLVGCNNNNSDMPTENLTNKINVLQNVEKVEVIYVYQVPSCFPCTTAGEYTEKLVNDTFQSELSSGKLEFRKVDINNPENKDLLDQYSAQFTGIYIGVYTTDDFSHSEYNYEIYLEDEEQFRQHLKEYITEKMGAK